MSCCGSRTQKTLSKSAYKYDTMEVKKLIIDTKKMLALADYKIHGYYCDLLQFSLKNTEIDLLSLTNELSKSYIALVDTNESITEAAISMTKLVAAKSTVENAKKTVEKSVHVLNDFDTIDNSRSDIDKKININKILKVLIDTENKIDELIEIVKDKE